MPIVSRYPTTDTAVSGTWSNPTAVQVEDGVAASVTIVTPLTAYDRRQGGYGFDAVLPNDVTINSVVIEVRQRVTTAAVDSFLENAVEVAGVTGTVNSDGTEPLVLADRSYVVARPGGGPWTRADLLDGAFSTRLRARTGEDIVDVRVAEDDNIRIVEEDYVRITEDGQLRVTEAGDVRIVEEIGARVTEESVTGVTAEFQWDYVRVVVDYTDLRIRVDLLHGTTPVTTRYLDGLTATLADFDLDLTSAELALITDISSLSVVMTSGLAGQQISATRLDVTGSPVVVVDTTPPTIVSLNPAAGAFNVAVGDNLVFTFSEPIAKGSGTLVLRTAAGVTVETFNVATSPRVTVSGNTMTVDPTALLNFSTTYFFDIPAGAVLDLSNNAYAGTTTYSFTTAVDSVGPTVLAYDPSIGATGVPLSPTLVLTFNENVQRGSGTIVLRTLSGTTVESFNAASSPRITIVGNTVSVAPSVALAINLIYFLDIPAGAFQDLQGNAYAGTSTYNFATITQAVTVTNFSPANGATNVGLLGNLSLTFNTNVIAGVGQITLSYAPNQVVETFNVVTSQRLAFSGSTLTIDPTNALEFGRVYYLTIPAGAITDLVGNAYVGTSSYSFTTQPQPGFSVIMPTAPKSGFWVALADSNHLKSAVEIQLNPAPSRVDYPNAPLGEMIETADGRVVTQQPNRDPRRRGWLWTNFGPLLTAYERQYRWLEGLRSRQRQKEGQSPYIYVYDGTTNLLNKRSVLTRNGATLNGARTVFTIADVSTTVVASQLVNATVDVYVGTATSAAQRTVVVAATNTTITVDPPIDASVTGTLNLKITYLEPYWWRVRVLDTVRTPLEAGVMRYPETRFVFVIEDPNGDEVA